VFTADCVPVTLVDRRSRRVAVAHAGRKGTLLGIATRALRQMAQLGTHVEDVLAWIGPAVCVYHYEVSEEMAAEFRDHFSHFPGAIGGSELRNLNLGVINWCQLVQAGLRRTRSNSTRVVRSRTKRCFTRIVETARPAVEC
jgi:copper oxidase (laccase) domain-containing protein